jgi:thiol-disulfide isomerase/thioredoxin
MNIKTVLIVLTLLTSQHFTMQAQEQLWQKRMDTKNDEPMIVGPCDLNTIDSLGWFKWLADSANTYKMDQEAIKALKKLIPNYKIVAFGGTWCGDTKDLMPRFYAISKALKLTPTQAEVLWVDRNKKGLNTETDFYEILYVPTFIVMKGPREVGRIVESISKESLEQELLYIINKDAVSDK